MYLDWSKSRKTPGTAGTFLKAYDDTSTIKKYYKLSNYNSVDGITGHECINEIVADRILDILDFEHLHYELIYADIVINNKQYKTYLCCSDDFKKDDERKVEIETYYELSKQKDERPIDYCIRMGFQKEIYQMIVIDFIICNRDRHGANIELLKNSKGKIRLAPLFDHGLSLFFNINDFNKLNNIDFLEDKKVQSFVGGSSLFENLKLMDKNKLPKIRKLDSEDKKYIFKDIDRIMPKIWVDSVWKLINKRINYYEDFCNKK